MNDLYKKLHTFQQEIEAIKRSETAKSGTFSYDYYDINALLKAIKPLFKKLNLLVVQPIVHEESTMVLKTSVIDTESDQMITGSMLLPTQTNPQEFGKVITYYRRYALASLLGLEAEDDDAASIVPKPVVAAAPSKAAPATDLSCPTCHVGSIVEKKNKSGGTFYSCDQFPKCRQSFSTLEEAERAIEEVAAANDLSKIPF